MRRITGPAVVAWILVAAAIFWAASPGAASAPPGGRALVLIENRNPGTANELLAENVVVVGQFGERLLAVAGKRDMAVIRGMALRHKVLDPDVRGKTYYTAFLGDERRADIAMSRVTILERDKLHAVFRASPEEADALAAEGIDFARVFLTPMRPHPPTEPIVPPSPLETDPLVQDMVDAVSITQVDSNVQRLQDFVTRYSQHDSCRAAAHWIKSEFESCGIDSVYFHEWSLESSPNVVAVLPGVAHPERVLVIGGHYDSITSDTEHAPGADDNASGTACVLECARVLSQHEFDYTIALIAFSGEEQGLLGSEAYAAEAVARGDDIVGMVAVDMIGYVTQGDATDLDIIDDPHSVWLSDRVMQAGALYVPGFSIVRGTLARGSSDHLSFRRHGYDAIMFFEDSDNYSPYIHTADDVVGVSYLSPALTQGSVKTAVAFIADLASPFRVAIAHAPLAHTEDETAPYRVVAKVLSADPLDPGSLAVRYSIGEGWSSLVLSTTGVPDEYEAFIPAQPGGTVVDYYLVAEDVNGTRALDPRSAPAETHTFAVGTLAVVFEDDFETDTGWTVGAAGDDATMGIWERADPNATYLVSTMVQPEDDHTADPGVACYVTGNSPPGAAQAQNDVDDGQTTLLSPILDLSGCTNAWVSYYRWYTNDTGPAPGLDYWVVDVSPDSGATWFRLETTNVSERTWALAEHNLLRHIPLTTGTRFRFIACDEEPGSIVEAALDDFLVVTYRSVMTSVLADRSFGPPSLRLEQNVPNPFNPETTIRFGVPAPGEVVSLKIYDVAGRTVATLLDGEKVAGSRTVRWDGRDNTGRIVASGVYFYRLEAGRESVSKKLVVLR